MNSKKSIILLMPETNGISAAIILELKKKGFEVYDFILSDATFKYKNIFQKIYNFYRKTIFQDYSFKNELKKHARVTGFSKKLAALPKTDFAIIIRPDLIPTQLVEQIKLKTNKTIGYQWDGMKRFPEIFKYTNLFDRFFTFDNIDIDPQKGILPLTNFYIPAEYDSKINKSSVYFIGTYDEYRFNILEKFKKTLIKIDSKLKLFFIPNNEKEAQILKDANYPLIEKIDYSKNLELTQESKILIDIVSSEHSGLSFRIFEALGYEKKLITNNTEIKKYDFYHPNNIFIWNGSNEDDILEFLKLDYIPIDPQIKSKYSFNNWINYMLEEGEYDLITLPNKD